MELFSAIAPGGPEGVAGEALGVGPDEDDVFGADLALD
jgi:hypothetical protein